MEKNAILKKIKNKYIIIDIFAYTDQNNNLMQ